MCNHDDEKPLSPADAKAKAIAEAEQFRAAGLDKLADIVLRDAGLTD